MSRDEDGGLPHDRAAEELVLACMMASRQAGDDAAAVLVGPGDFYVPAHQVIYEAIAGLAGRDEPSGPVAVADALAAAGQLGKAGGAEYLDTLTGQVPVEEAGFYARIVRDRSAERQMIAAGAGIVRAGRARGLDLAGKVDEAYRVLDEASGLTAPAGARLIAELLPGALDRIENGPDLAGVPTGWGDLDELTGGWPPGLHIVAGRPTTGKSTILLNTSSAAAAAGVPTVVFSLEMPERECTVRILSAEALVDGTRLRDGTLDDGDWERLTAARERVAGWPLRISDDPYLGVAGIRAELRSLRRAGEPAGLVVVDYVQLMAGGRAESRQEEVSGISRGLKLLSKELDVPVVVGAQLNRGPEMRSDHRPLLADLRSSGSLEQDADMVILLHREDAYERESPRAGEMDLIVAKHRGGPCATVTVAFQGWYSRAADMSGSWSPATAARGSRPDPAAAWDAAAQERRDELAAKRAERDRGGSP